MWRESIAESPRVLGHVAGIEESPPRVTRVFDPRASSSSGRTPDRGPVRGVAGRAWRTDAFADRRSFIVLCVLVAALVPSVAAAHAKWFVDTSCCPIRSDLIVSERTGILVAVALLGLIVLYGLRRLLGPDLPDAPFLRRMAAGAPTLLAVQAGIGLVAAAAEPALFAPNMALSVNAVGLTLAAVQIAIAFTFITGLGDWIGALALIALGPVGFLLFSPFDVLDSIHFAAMGVFVLVVGRAAVEPGHVRPWFARRGPDWSNRAIRTLRILAGLAAVAPAFSEKLWNPELGAQFLAAYPHFNVPRALLGMDWFTDDLFVLTIGVVEGTIGVLLASGLLTRVVILGMFVPFHLGVPFLPAAEYLGHIPLFAIMYVLLVHPRHAAPRTDSSAA